MRKEPICQKCKSDDITVTIDEGNKIKYFFCECGNEWTEIMEEVSDEK